MMLNTDLLQPIATPEVGLFLRGAKLGGKPTTVRKAIPEHVAHEMEMRSFYPPRKIFQQPCEIPRLFSVLVPLPATDGASQFFFYFSPGPSFLVRGELQRGLQNSLQLLRCRPAQPRRRETEMNHCENCAQKEGRGRL